VKGRPIRRRRECLGCGHRFTTYEEIERETLMVVKRDGRREEFSKEKLLSGLKKACQKRPISPQVIENLVEDIVDKVTANTTAKCRARKLANLGHERSAPD